MVYQDSSVVWQDGRKARSLSFSGSKLLVDSHNDVDGEQLPDHHRLGAVK